jgi:hypothetical protein
MGHAARATKDKVLKLRLVLLREGFKEEGEHAVASDVGEGG